MAFPGAIPACCFIVHDFKFRRSLRTYSWAPTSSANRWHVIRRTCHNPLPTANRLKCVSKKVGLCTCSLLCAGQFALLGRFVFVRCFIHLFMIAQKQMPLSFMTYLSEGRKKLRREPGEKKVYIVSSLQALLFIRLKAHKTFWAKHQLGHLGSELILAFQHLAFRDAKLRANHRVRHLS